MRKLITLSLVAMLTTSPALAEGTKTVTIDNDKVSGSKSVTRDGSGNINIDGTLTRKSDGATATRVYDRSKTDNGWTASGERTGFEGQSRSFEYERQRTESGFEASGTAQNSRGDSYNYSAYGTRGDDSRERGRTVTRNGSVVYNRLDTAERNDSGQIVRNSTVTREPDFRPKRRMNPLQPDRSKSIRRGGSRRSN